MRVVSFVGQHYQDEFNNKPYKPWEWTSTPYPFYPGSATPPPSQEEIKRQIEKLQRPPISNKELENQIQELRKQVEEMKKFLIEAIEYDKLYKQPDCGNEMKIAFLKKVAESVGLTLEDIFPTKPTPPSHTLKKHTTPKKRT